MRYLKKIGITLIVFSFIFQSFSLPLNAIVSSQEVEEENVQIASIVSENEANSVPLYEEASETSTILALLEAKVEVIVLERLESFSLVEYIEKENNRESFRGFILNESLTFQEDEQFNVGVSNDEQVVEKDTNFSNGEELDNPSPEDHDTEEIPVNKEDNAQTITDKTEASNSQAEIGLLQTKQETYFGIALKDKTNVYKTTSTDSILKSYAQGSLLKYKSTTTKDWYEAVVMHNGEWTTGYIHKNDVENIDNTPTTLYGIASKKTTKVYSKASTESSSLRTYEQGSILKYKTLTSEWYEATVMHNGQWTTGYIHKDDVENTVVNKESLQGIGLKDSTHVYTKATRSSKSLKSYVQGSILKYRTFSNDWYEATVYINGNPTIGYIHKSDVETLLDNKETLSGVGLKNPTAVYSKASTNSLKLKTYSIGSILKYRTFSENWYEATVKYNGEWTTGYIHKSHVENATDTPQNLKGIGLNSPTHVYTRASTNSEVLKSYSHGTILKYRTFSSSWYEATVYINGVAKTGYIHTNHVEGLESDSKSLDGIALKNPTNVYAKASKSSSILKSYAKTSYLKFKTFSKNWYEATVYINGKANTGYIHHDDVSADKVITNVTNYSTNFKTAVDIQMTRTPKADGQGQIPATRSQVEYYINSSNFSKSSADYLQFLVLSKPAGLNATEVNKKILNNHGTLTNQAKAFIDAGKKHNVNEAYLIAHALLETGNGSSTLAKGVPVDNKGNVVSADKAVHTVYNMYGIGAVDGKALEGGAKRAFNEGWFTPADAIIGGAEFINTYISRGQDTLYKMRWNPSSPGHPQYATDVAWAIKQTANISRIYNLLDDFILIYDVPRYSDQPSSSGNKDAGINTDGTSIEITASSLNVRTGAGTSYASIGGVNKGTVLNLSLDKNNKIISKNVEGHVWYQVIYANSIAWVSGGTNGTEYIKIIGK